MLEHIGNYRIIEEETLGEPTTSFSGNAFILKPPYYT